MKTWRNKWCVQSQALYPAWTDEQRYLSFAVCQDSRKTIVMSPTFFPRCDAFKLAYRTKELVFPVGPHQGAQPCLCFNKIDTDHKVGHEILINSCFTCCHESALEIEILHAAGHLEVLKKHATAFKRAKDGFDKGRPSHWTKKFFNVVETRVVSFRDYQFTQNDKHKYFCDYCSLPLGHPEQWLNYPERIDGICACHNMWFQTSLDNCIATSIPHCLQLMRGVRSYTRRCKREGQPIERYWCEKGYDGSQTSSRWQEYAPPVDTRQSIRRPPRNSLKDDNDPSLGKPKLTLQIIAIRLKGFTEALLCAKLMKITRKKRKR